MSKVWIIAVNEYRQVVFTRSFLLGLLLPPLFYGGMLLLMVFASGTADLSDRRIVIVDQSRVLYSAFEAAAASYNRGSAVYDHRGRQVGPQLEVELYRGETRDLKELEVELSDRVRAGEAFAFVVIGAGYEPIEGRADDYLRYYSRTPTEQVVPAWVRETAEQAVENRRLEAEGLAPGRVRQIFSHNRLEQLNLAERTAEGEILRPQHQSWELSLLVPVLAVLMLFFGVQMATPVLLNSVIHEKTQRIAEVLLSSITPAQLLWGKLLAGCAVGLSFAGAYVATGIIALWQFEGWNYAPAGILIYFFPFLLVSLLTFGSLMAAVSASCQDFKDAQNMAGAVILLVAVPLVLSIGIISAPEGTLARMLSFIPPFSPMVMTVRLAVLPGPAWWEPLLAWVINLAFSGWVAVGAARIFRIGILSEGQAPTWRQMVRWALRG